MTTTTITLSLHYNREVSNLEKDELLSDTIAVIECMDGAPQVPVAPAAPQLRAAPVGHATIYLSSSMIDTLTDALVAAIDDADYQANNSEGEERDSADTRSAEYMTVLNRIEQQLETDYGQHDPDPTD